MRLRRGKQTIRGAKTCDRSGQTTGPLNEDTDKKREDTKQVAQSEGHDERQADKQKNEEVRKRLANKTTIARRQTSSDCNESVDFKQTRRR